MGENRTKTENTIVAFTLARQKIWPRLEQGWVGAFATRGGHEAIRQLECKAKAFNSFRKHSQNRKTETNNQNCRTSVFVSVCVGVYECLIVLVSLALVN